MRMNSTMAWTIRLRGVDHGCTCLAAVLRNVAVAAGRRGQYMQFWILRVLKRNELSEVDGVLLEEPVCLVQVAKVQFEQLQVPLDLLFVGARGWIGLHFFLLLLTAFWFWFKLIIESLA